MPSLPVNNPLDRLASANSFALESNSTADELAIACRDFLENMGYEVRLPGTTENSTQNQQTNNSQISNSQISLEAIPSDAVSAADRSKAASVKVKTLRELVQTKIYHLGFDRSEEAILAYEVFNDDSFSSYLEVNASACRLLGYLRTELLQLSPQQIDVTTPNPSLSHGKNSCDRLFLSKSGEKIAVVVTVKVSVIQGKRIAVTFIKPFIKTANLSSVDLVSVDRSDRQEGTLPISQNLQVSLDAIPSYIAWIDAGDCYLGMNQKLADRLGITPKQAIGQKVGYRFGSNLPRFIQQFRQSEEKCASIINRDVNLNGDRPASCLIVAQKHEDQIVFVGIDITEQETDRSTLQESNQALETKVRIRTAELASVSHKLACEIEEKERIEHSLSFHLKRVETAYRMVFAMNQAETLEDIYSRSLRGLVSIFQVSRLGILLAEQGVMRFKVTRGLSDTFRQTVEKLAQRSHDPGDNTTQPMIYYDTVDLPFPKPLQSAMEAEAIEAMVVFPLIHSGLVIGEIVIYSDRSLKLTQEEVQMGKTIASYIAVAITRKQTEISLRKSEGQFRQIFRDASIGMALANIRTRRFTKVNSALCQMLDFSEVEFLTLAIDDITHPQDLSQDMRHLLQASYGQIESYRLEKRFIKKEGQILWASSTVTLLRDVEGHPTSILIMVEDTSDRKAAETQTRKTEALRLELEKEKELNSLRTRFFSMASHEFRTPIGAILMNANILEYANDTALNQKSLRSLQRIRANVKHLISLLDDVLTINRADTGRLEFRPQLQDVRVLCSRVIEELFTEDSLLDRVKFQPEGDRQYLAMIDEKLFHHMLTNLLANALKYSDSNSEVWIELGAKEFGKISLQIRDRGIGIGEKDIPHLFDAFYRGENVGKVTGSGLGLTIVRKSIELHGGEIEVTSQIGTGTCFKVVLPTPFLM
jgi:PAS domain S-box-containing protein